MRRPTARWPNCSRCVCAYCFKKSPAQNTAQARQLIARAIADDGQRVSDAPAIGHYHQRRNRAAYCAHGKRPRARNPR